MGGGDPGRIRALKGAEIGMIGAVFHLSERTNHLYTLLERGRVGW